MYLCYVDEAGCLGALPNGTSPIQPVFVLAGLIVDACHVQALTLDLLMLKRRFYPNLLSPDAQFLDWIQAEVKGNDVRGHIRRNSRNRRRHAIGFLDGLVTLLEDHGARLIGRLYVKGIGTPFQAQAVYTSSVQSMCSYFQQYLTHANDHGFVILDSRDKPKNANVSHSVFTQKFQSAGDCYGRLVEMPVFGHSDNHAGIQVSDLICSALLFPMATFAYCLGHVSSIHVHESYGLLRDQFGNRLQNLQYRYKDPTDRWRGGITVSDALTKRPGSLLFSSP